MVEMAFVVAFLSFNQTEWGSSKNQPVSFAEHALVFISFSYVVLITLHSYVKMSTRKGSSFFPDHTTLFFLATFTIVFSLDLTWLDLRSWLVVKKCWVTHCCITLLEPHFILHLQSVTILQCIFPWWPYVLQSYWLQSAISILSYYQKKTKRFNNKEIFLEIFRH